MSSITAFYHERVSRVRSTGQMWSERVATFLARRAPVWVCIAAWLTSFFLAVRQVAGVRRPSGDVDELAPDLLPIAHGHLAQAFPLHPVQLPPGFDIVAAPIAWVARIYQLGPGFMRLGLIGWLALAVGWLWLVHRMGFGWTWWEVAGILGLGLIPHVQMAMVFYFHPEDLVAYGLLLGALAAILAGRWALAGGMLAFGTISKQFDVLVVLGLVVLCPPSRRVRFIVGGAAVVGAVLIPLGLATHWRVLYPVLGVGYTVNPDTYLSLLPANHLLVTGVSRGMPMALSIAGAWYLKRRLGERCINPVPLVTLFGLAMALRVAFEVVLWPYYLAGVEIALVLADMVHRRFPVRSILWIGMASLALPLNFDQLAFDLYGDHIELSAAVIGWSALFMFVHDLASSTQTGFPTRSSPQAGVGSLGPARSDAPLSAPI